MIEMVLSVPLGTNYELVGEILNAVMHVRLDNKGDEYDARNYYNLPLPLRGSYRDKRNSGACYGRTEYLVNADYISVEFMEVIEELKSVLPIETYFENRGDTATSYEARMEYFYDGDIEDDALWRLWDEEPHKPREKIGAKKIA